MTAKVDCKIQDAGFKICCKKKIIIFCEVFVNRNERFVPLHRRKKERRKKNAKGRQELFSGAPEFSPCPARKK
jgi:hypothetical protein